VYNNQYRDRYSAQRSEPLVTMVMRDRFDHALVQHAQGLGVRVITGEAVRGLDRSVDAHGGSVIDLHTDQRRCTARAV
ncbi:NAD(P)/FAD-dependent oxidoreductase, partial [Escherichia coli]|uniref:NAD(P)/FAD-dependent oxidoreductase n=1 Tax=Escherichia coli TaxID=562 RepID=UPI001BDB931E